MKVVYVSEGPNGCGLYRAELPIRYLPQHGIQARLSHVNALDHELLWADVIVVQKQFERPFYNRMLSFRKKGRKIVYEVDDDVFNIPPWNPAHSFYQRVKSSVVQYLRSAHAVTVTNAHLKNQMSKHNPNVHVCPNSLDFDELDTLGAAPEQISALNRQCKRIPRAEFRARCEGKVVIGWFGSPTHKRDLQIIIPVLKQLCRKYRGRIHIVMGGCVDREILKNTPDDMISLLEMVPPRVYMRYLASVGLTIGLAPVDSHIFNHSKSNLKVIEYQAAGAVPVASDLVTYNTTIKNGVNGYLCRGTKDWVATLSDLIEDPALVARLQRDGMQFVRSNFDIKRTVSRWADVYANL